MAITQPLEIPDPKEAEDFFKKKMVFTTGPTELRCMMERKDPIHVVDVRAEKDFKEGHIPGSINLPEDRWGEADLLARHLAKDKVNVLVCYSHVCHLAATAALKFASEGYPVMEMDGGMKAWRDDNKFEVEKA